MKKLCLSFIAVFSLITAVSSFAATQNNPRNYSSSIHPNAALIKATKAKGPLSTYLVVYNNGYNPITAIVPNTPVNDPIYPNSHVEIYADGNAPTYLVLLDAYGKSFFSDNVCHYAQVYVTDRDGPPHVYYIDNRRC